MPLWRFLEFHPRGEPNPFADWYAAQEPYVQAALEATLVTLGAMADWNDPEVEQFDVFTRKVEDLGLAQVKYEVERERRKRQFRVIGLWREELRELVMLMGFEKSGRSPIPADAFIIARRMRLLVEEDKGLLYEHA